ncbi:MAG: hypothetical protein GF353_16185 [Candidatus Lokiarchaeota archaeon]|nr:hypothetical protein [Candidatus Lokiarchaeota archaeon]
MIIPTKKDLQAIIKKSEWQKIIGFPETSWLECKGEPYDFESKNVKQEYAKDVSSMANAIGGYIIIGVRTKQDPTHKIDLIDQLRPIKSDMIDIGQYKSITNDWIFPDIENITFEWKKYQNDTGFLLITIPEQFLNKPFLVTRTIEENNKTNELVFGYFIRKDDRVHHFSVQQLQALIKDGLRFDSISSRLDELENYLYQNLSSTEKSDNNKSIEEKLSQRIDDALEKVELKKNPSFVLSCFTPDKFEINSLFQSQESDVMKILNNPPRLRYGGWGLQVHNKFNIYSGKYRRAVDPRYKILELWKDGTIIFIVSANQDYLAWGNYSSEDEPLRINSYALVESTLLFTKLCSHIYKLASHKAKIFYFQTSLRNMTSDSQLYRLPVHPQKHYMMYKEAPSENFHAILGPFKVNESYSHIAYNLIGSIYEWFGIEQVRIPFGNIDTKEINEEAISKFE